jgi:hypothetical protein
MDLEKASSGEGPLPKKAKLSLSLKNRNHFEEVNRFTSWAEQRY